MNEYQLRHELGLTTADLQDMDPEKLAFFSAFAGEVERKQQQEMERARKEATKNMPRRHH